jgi:hypothetical protein
MKVARAKKMFLGAVLLFAASVSGCAEQRVCQPGAYPWDLDAQRFDRLMNDLGAQARDGNRIALRDLVYAGLWTDTEFSNRWSEELEKVASSNPKQFFEVVEAEPIYVRREVESALGGDLP